MKKLFLLVLCLLLPHATWSAANSPVHQVDVHRNGNQYSFSANIETSLSKCAAYHYLTDYDAATHLPGIIESTSSRQPNHKVNVNRTAIEHILFFHVKLHSLIAYTESPPDSLTFVQLEGDSKEFQGSWQIVTSATGSTLMFNGQWEPDTLVPLFIIDHFAKNGLIEKFNAIAELAEQRKSILQSRCEE